MWRNIGTNTESEGLPWADTAEEIVTPETPGIGGSLAG
jgi:hypothetical protein